MQLKESIFSGFAKKDNNIPFDGKDSYLSLKQKPYDYVVVLRENFFGISLTSVLTNSKKAAKKFAKKHPGAIIYKAIRKNKYVGKQ